MVKRVTISEVAKEAGVSVSTVSRILNNHPNVTPELRNRVQDAIKKLGYIPNASAQYVRTGNSRILGMIIPTASNQYFGKILDGALDCALEKGYRITTFSSNGNAEKDIQCLYSVAASAATGLIYCPISVASSEHLNVVFSKNMPVVIASRRGIIPGVPHVYTDDVQGGYTVTKFLLHQGHRRIAFFAGFWENPASNVDELMELMDSDQRGAYSSLDRLAGYQKALQEAGVPFDQNLIAMTSYDYDGGYKAMKRYLTSMTEFDAVICSNDWVASGVLQALQEQNISVPGQVSVVGYDNTEVARISRPMLTSVRQYPYDIGYTAVNMLIAMLKGRTVEDKMIGTDLIVRNSTAVKRPPSPYIDNVFVQKNTPYISDIGGGVVF